jgi:hypothetical protein
MRAGEAIMGKDTRNHMTMTKTVIDRQVFIGGCGRSGTTLMGAMLGAHSACITTPESHFKTSVLQACGGDPEKTDPLAALDLIRRHWRFKIWGLDIDPADVPVSEVGTSYSRLLMWTVARYAQQNGKPEARIWIDHTPANVRQASMLLEAFPEAKFVHIIRDGRGVACSIMPLDWGPNTAARAANWWLEAIVPSLAFEAMLGEDRIIRVRYEDLVSAPEETLGALCARLGIDYEDRMIEGSGFKPPQYTVSQHELIGKAPDANRASRWEKRLTPRQIEIFESLAHDCLSGLGYPLQYGRQARKPTLPERLASTAVEVFQGGIINRIRWLVRSYPLWLSWDFLLERT